MRWFPVRVTGSSMEPTISDGDLLGVRWPHHGEPKVGQIVVVRRDGREDVKRVTELLGASVWVEGDNSGASTDSRTYGAVEPSAVVGVVRFRYRPLLRARMFR